MFLDKFTLKDVPDTELRQSVQFLIDKGVLTERDVVAVVVSRELSAVEGGNGKPAAQAATKSGAGVAGTPARKRRRAGGKVDASRAIQGQYLSALNRVPKTRKKEFSSAKQGGREQAIAAINKAYPLQQ